MNAIICEEPYFQWDDNTCTCLGCVENGVLHDNCRYCEDYAKNVSLEEFYEPLNIR